MSCGDEWQDAAVSEETNLSYASMEKQDDDDKDNDNKNNVANYKNN